MEVERLSKLLYARLENRRGRLTAEKAAQIKQLIREIVADVESGQKKRDWLDDEVAHIEKLIELEGLDQSENVVRLDRFRESRFPLNRVEGKSRGQARRSGDQADRLSFISGDVESNWRRAVDLHHESGRYALVNYRDINQDVWADAESVKKLGAVTVFIAEISELTAEEQDKVSRFAHELSDDSADGGVHFVVATTSKLRFTN